MCFAASHVEFSDRGGRIYQTLDGRSKPRLKELIKVGFSFGRSVLLEAGEKIDSDFMQGGHVGGQVEKEESDVVVAELRRRRGRIRRETLGNFGEKFCRYWPFITWRLCN